MLATIVVPQGSESDVMLLRQRDGDVLLRTQALAEALKEVATELRLVNLADFVTYIQLEQFTNIQDLVDSSIELFFKHGTLIYGAMADFELDWDRPPTVTLGMEFNYNSVSILFDLVLQTFGAGVEIRATTFGDQRLSMEEETQTLIHAIASARMTMCSKSKQH